MLTLILASAMAVETQQLNLACMHAEDYVLATRSMAGIERYIEHKTQQISPNDTNFRMTLHSNAMNCARQMSRDEGLVIPPQYVLK